MATGDGASTRLSSLAIVLIAVSTIVLLPGALNRWVLPKEIVFLVGALLAAAVPAAGRLPRWFWMIVLSGSAVLLIAALSGAAPLPQVFGRWPRFEGLVTLPVYLAAAWAGARLFGGVAALRHRVFLSVVAVSALAVFLVAALETLGLRPIPSDLDRPGSLLGNATDQGIVGVMFAALLVLPALAPRMPGPGAATRGGGASRATGAERPAPPRPRAAGTLWLLRAGLLAAALSTVLSASRAATAALFAVAVVASVVLVARRASGDRRSATVHALLALAGIAGLVAAVLLVPLSRERIFDVAALDPARLGDRFTIWREAAQLLWANPLLGVGPSGYLDQIAAVHSATWFFDVGSGVTIDSPHNLLLQAGLAGGIPLLLCLGALAVLSAVTAWRRIRSGDDAVLGATLALLGFTIVLLTHFTAPATTLLAALLLGMVVARPADVPIGSVATRTPTASRFPAAPRGRAGRGLRMLGVTALAASTLLVAVSCSAEVALGAGVSAAADSRLADADAAFATAAALRPWDADTRSIAAQSFAQAADSGQPGAPGLAGSWAARALDLAPDSVLSAKALAVSQQYSGDLDGALETLTALDDRAPNDPETLHRLGGVQFLDGRIPDAQQALERAVAVDPDDADAWLTLQYVYQQTGDSAGFARASGELARLGRN